MMAKDWHPNRTDESTLDPDAAPTMASDVMVHQQREAPPHSQPQSHSNNDHPHGQISRHGSLGSDECDMDAHHQEVEVTFSPGKPQGHRRKSSMVDPRQYHQRTECFVHQFIDSHRRANQRLPRDRTPSSATTSTQAQTPLDSAATTTATTPTTAEQDGDDQRPVLSPVREEEASGSDSFQRCGGFGQADETRWAGEMMASNSKMRMLVTGSPGASSDESASGDEAHSRLLTKRQLNEMVWGVRELGRRLGSMRVRFTARSILILTKIYDEDLIPITRELTSWLLCDKERGTCYTVYVDERLRDNGRFDAAGLVDEVCLRQAGSGGAGPNGTKDTDQPETEDDDLETPPRDADNDVAHRLRYWNADMCRSKPHLFDFVITLGGDGTVLYASWLFQRIVPPVLSFSLGSLGFLSKFDFGGYRNTLTTALTKGVTISLRLRFEGTIMRSQPRGDHGGRIEGGRKRDLVEELIGEEHDGEDHTHRPDATYEILNEIVVDRGPNPTLSNLEIFGDDEHFTSVLADGICVSTPTGSTAYNLASGGSLCHPDNPVMLMTAICAHTLSFRPLVLPDTIVLRVGVPYMARTTSWASFDGRERIELLPGDYVTISASRYPFACVQSSERNRGEDWVNSISHKLGWNTRQKQKDFKEWAS
jgi:NAD+ kinase